VKGFTLLEVMISLAIMAGVLLTVISSFNYHLSQVDRDSEETVAVLLGRAKMDDPDIKGDEGQKGNFAPDHPEIAWKSEIAATDYPGVKRLSLTLSWDLEKRKVVLVRYQAK
jgi:general secretion pathway protein I